MEVSIVYKALYEYESQARCSHNLLRLRPCSDARQQLIEFGLKIAPPSEVFTYSDYWGTSVEAFGVHQDHTRLSVVARATVRTNGQPAMVDSPPADALRDGRFREGHWEFLQPSPLVSWNDAIETLSQSVTESVDEDVIARVLALHRWVGRNLSFDETSTRVGTSVEEVLEQGKGACQDFAHVLVALCRAAGIPARYVSGYFLPANEHGESSEADSPLETHAWVEAGIPRSGWWGLDPTHRMEVSARHVVIGRGRDYADVTPLRGSDSAGGRATQAVEVEMAAAASQQ